MSSVKTHHTSKRAKRQQNDTVVKREVKQPLPTNVTIDCRGFADDGRSQLNEWETQLASPLHIPKGTNVSIASLSAAVRGSGDVIEVQEDMETTMTFGFWLRQCPVNPYLVMNAYDYVEQGAATAADPAGHFISDFALGEYWNPLVDGNPDHGRGVSFHTELQSPDPTAWGGGSLVGCSPPPGATAARECLKMLPAIERYSEFADAPSPPRVFGYQAMTAGKYIVGHPFHEANDGTKSDPKFGIKNLNRIAPVTKKVTLRIPRGTYSPGDIEHLLNRQLSKVEAGDLYGTDPNIPPADHTGRAYLSSGGNAIRTPVAMQTALHAQDMTYLAQQTRYPSGEKKVQPAFCLLGRAKTDPDIGNWPNGDNVAKAETRIVHFNAKAGGHTAAPCTVPQVIGAPNFSFLYDTNRSRFGFQDLHHGLGETDFKCVTQGSKCRSRGIESDNHTNRTGPLARPSIAAQCAWGIDYFCDLLGLPTKDPKAKNEGTYVEPQLGDGDDGFVVVGMNDPTLGHSTEVDSFGGAFVMSFTSKAQDEKFWRVLGFTQREIFEPRAEPIAGELYTDGSGTKWHVYNSDELFAQLVDNPTTTTVMDTGSALADVQGASTAGVMVYDPRMQSIYNAHRVSMDPANLIPLEVTSTPQPHLEPLPLWQGKNLEHPLHVANQAHVNRLMAIVHYWHFCSGVDGQAVGSSSIGNDYLSNSGLHRFIVSAKTKPVLAAELPRKFEFPDLLLTTNLPLFPMQQYVAHNGQSTSVLAVLPKLFSSGDFYAQNGIQQVFQFADDVHLSHLQFRLLNPDLTVPTLLTGACAVVLKIEYTPHQPNYAVVADVPQPGTDPSPKATTQAANKRRLH